MSNCLNCGETWYDCICIPWCHEHNCAHPCHACDVAREREKERRATLKTFTDPWYVNLYRFLTGG